MRHCGFALFVLQILWHISDRIQGHCYGFVTCTENPSDDRWLIIWHLSTYLLLLPSCLSTPSPTYQLPFCHLQFAINISTVTPVFYGLCIRVSSCQLWHRLFFYYQIFYYFKCWATIGQVWTVQLYYCRQVCTLYFQICWSRHAWECTVKTTKWQPVTMRRTHFCHVIHHV